MDFSNTIERIERSLFEALRKTSIAAGYLPDRLAVDEAGERIYPDNAEGETAFKAACDSIRFFKGFYVPIYGVASPHEAHEKQTPRIVIRSIDSLPGSLGADSNYIYEYNEQEDQFVEVLLPPKTVDLSYRIYTVAKNIKERRIINNILGTGLPRRHYLKMYDNPSQRFLILNTAGFDLSDPTAGILENVYHYQIPDVYDSIPLPTGQVVSPLREMTIDIKDAEGKLLSEVKINE